MGGPLPIGGPLPAPPGADAKSDTASPELVEAAREFEALIMNMMLKSMRSTVERGDLFGDTKHIETYEQLLDQEYAKGMADQGGLGFADLIVKQFADAGQGAADLRRAGAGLKSAGAGIDAYRDAAVAAPLPPGGNDR